MRRQSSFNFGASHITLKKISFHYVYDKTCYLFFYLSIAKDDSTIAPGTSHPMGERGNVLNRVGHQQDKWKRQVREQRRNIYDRHTMLN